jgi:hypothetical protein
LKETIIIVTITAVIVYLQIGSGVRFALKNDFDQKPTLVILSFVVVVAPEIAVPVVIVPDAV